MIQTPGRSVREAMRPSKRPQPLLGLAGYIVLGGVLGGVSVVIFPHKFAVPAWLQIANIVASPLVVGVILVSCWAMASTSKSADNTSA